MIISKKLWLMPAVALALVFGGYAKVAEGQGRAVSLSVCSVIYPFLSPVFRFLPWPSLAGYYYFLAKSSWNNRHIVLVLPREKNDGGGGGAGAPPLLQA
jgi:hypothetical protein